MKCSSCDHIVDRNYCSNCGRPNHLLRIDIKYILHEIGSALSFKKGILFTIKELLIRPGKSVKSFILEDRNRLVKPIIFLIFCSFIYTILQQLLHFEDVYYEDVYNEINSNSASFMIFNWVRNNYSYANILSGIFMAIWLKILFRKYDYKVFELIVLWLFIAGIGMLIYSAVGIIETFSGLRLFYVSGIIGLIYTCWAIGEFYGKRNFLNYLKALLSYVLGLLLFSVSAAILGRTIDAIIN
ncbi:MAG: DUF3667 domain-containing protein [Bacteroidota bacterium]